MAVHMEWMGRRCRWLLLLGLAGCSTSERFVLSPVLAEPAPREHDQGNNGPGARPRGFVEVTQRLAPAVQITDTAAGQLQYRVQGNFSSAGLSARRIGASQQQQRREGDHLIVQHYLQLAAVAGKEGALVRGYNYQRDYRLTLPAGITRVSIELHERRVARSGQAAPAEPYRLLAQTTRDL